MHKTRVFMPVLINLTGKKILLIGGDNSAFKKLKLLRRFTDNIDVLAINVNKEIKACGVKWIEKPYETTDLNGYFMVYSCTNNPDTDNRIVKDGHDNGILVNIHDKPLQCDFVSPAIYKDGNLTVSVGSNGEDVFKSIRIRDILKNYLIKKKVK